MRRSLCAWALMLAASLTQAQLMPIDPDWQEVQAPRPPAFKVDGLIALDRPGSTLRFGVDPSSVSVASDGIVRYVVVAISATGAANGIYEGIRCRTGEFKVYSRHASSGDWVIARNSNWQSLHDPQPSSHSLTIARSAACIGDGTNRSASQIVRDLRESANTRFTVN